MKNSNNSQGKAGHDPRTRWADLPAIVFLLAAIIIASGRLTSTEWVEGLNRVYAVATLGSVVGLVAGYSKFSARTAGILTGLYGIFLVPWQLVLTTDDGPEWLERTGVIYNRLAVTSSQLLNQKDITDSILFLTAMLILFWILPAVAGFALTRSGNGWYATMPLGAALFFIHINDRYWPFRAWFLGVFLVLALMIIARMAYLRLNADWQQRRTRLPAFVGLDLSRAALIAAIPLILLAWTAPAFAISLPSMRDSWQSFTVPLRDRLDYIFASLRSNVVVLSDYYNDSLPLGRGNRLSDDIVMLVRAPVDAPAGVRYYWQARSFELYTASGWETARTTVRNITPELFDQQLNTSDQRWQADLVFEPQISMRTLHTVPQTYGVGYPGEAELAVNPDGSVDIAVLFAEPFARPGVPYTVRAALTNATIKDLREAGTEYPEWVLERYTQLPTNITDRTYALAERIVAEAGAETPYDQAQAITNYLRNNIIYSEIVDNPPPGQERVDWLLFDYKKGFCNYYASAEVVLLRTLGIPARISVGYTTGEALEQTTQVSIPTTAAGQAAGSQPNTLTEMATYIVRQRDLHAWPEVYFPGIGWVEFEPTTSQAPISRRSGADPGGAALEDEQSPLDLPPDIPAIPDDLPPGSEFVDPQAPVDPVEQVADIALRVGIALGGTGLVLAAVLGIGNAISPTPIPVMLISQFTRAGIKTPGILERWAKFTVARRRHNPTPLPVQIEKQMLKFGLKPPKFLQNWARYAALPGLTKAYLEINQALKRMGNPPVAAATPTERVEELVEILPMTSEPANRLLEQYQTQIYSPRPPEDDHAVEAGIEIRNTAIVAAIKQWWNGIGKPKRRRQYRPYFD